MRAGLLLTRSEIQDLDILRDLVGNNVSLRNIVTSNDGDPDKIWAILDHLISDSGRMYDLAHNND